MGIYTRTGDQGESGTLKGERLPKSHIIFEVEGRFDSLNAALGAARLESRLLGDDETQGLLRKVQGDLLLLAACVSGDESTYLSRLQLSPALMETAIDKAVPVPLTAFVLPGANRQEVSLHHARVVCRELERVLVRYERATCHSTLMTYVNRLSDLLFALAVNSAQRT